MSKARTAARLGRGALFIGASIIQRKNQEMFQALVPEQLADYREIMQPAAQAALAGLGLSFLVPKLIPIARWGGGGFLTATLIPAIGQVAAPEQTDKLGLPRSLVIARIPVQVLVIGATWYATSPED